MSIRINDFVLGGRNKMSQSCFDKKYKKLIGDCKMTVEDILKKPWLRTSKWIGEESYKKLIQNFRESEKYSFD